MKFKTLLNKLTGFTNSPIGEAIQAVPGIGNVVSGLDAILDNIGLDKTDSVKDIRTAINDLSDEHKQAVLEKQLDVQIVDMQTHSQTAIAMANADKDGSSTRPEIAKQMSTSIIKDSSTIFVAIGLALGADIVLQALAKQTFALDLMLNLAPWLISALIGPKVLIIAHYMGMRSADKAGTKALLGGQPVPAPPTGLLASLGGFMVNRGK